MTDTADRTDTEPRPPLAHLLENGPVRADPPRRSRQAGIWMDKLAPLVMLQPNEWYLVEQFPKQTQAENAATNLRREKAQKPPLPPGQHWKFSSAAFPKTPADPGHSSLYAMVVAPDVKIENPTPVAVHEERLAPGTVEPDPVEAAPTISEAEPPEPVGVPIPVETITTSTLPVDHVDVTSLPEPDYESLKAENDSVSLDEVLGNGSLERALEAANEPTDDEIPF